MLRINLSRRQILRRLHLLLVTVVMVWFVYSTRAQGFDKQILNGDDVVQVREQERYWQFAPQAPATRALIFIPGALVDPTAYAPMAYALAENGVTAYLIKPSWFGIPWSGQAAHVEESVRRLIGEETAVNHWFIGGHSRGGVMAGRLILTQPDMAKGLILVGTSHPKEPAYDLSHLARPVMKVYASEDGLASVAEVRQNQIYLPPHTQYVLIEGGNHAQFGWYGMQLGDQQANISREAQQAQLVAAILALINGAASS